ncbi:hypothetical protein [Sphaerothrix gracilis]|uniref:hypothetical protein n=1 Tax=Sphaerothrix gracilis TaxID=3151835 RepID=UPI0031FC29EB
MKRHSTQLLLSRSVPVRRWLSAGAIAASIWVYAPLILAQTAAPSLLCDLQQNRAKPSI